MIKRILFLFLLLNGGAAFGVQHVIDDNSDLPYTVTVANDTITVATDGLSSNSFIIRSSYAGTVVIGNDNTIYGAAALDMPEVNHWHSLILLSGHDSRVRHLKVRQSPLANQDSVKAFHIGGTYNIFLDTCSGYVHGDMSMCVFTEGAGPQISIVGGHYANAGDGFQQRDLFDAAAIYLMDNDPRVLGQYPNDLPYRYRVKGVTIDSCLFGGIVIYANGLTYVDSNTIYLQTHNDWYDYPSGSMMFGAANCYGINVCRFPPGHAGYRSRISGNVIMNLGGWNESPNRSREGGNGIGCGGSNYQYSSVEVWGNDVRTSQGKDDGYGYQIPSQSFKTEEGLDSLFLYDNYFETRASTADATTDIGRQAANIWLADATPDSYWRIYNNHCVTQTDGYLSGYDEGSNVYALALESDCTGADILLSNNYWRSNCIPIHFGSRNGQTACDVMFDADTVFLASPSYADGGSRSGAICMTDGALDNVARDLIFMGGTTITNDGGTPYEMTFEKTFRVRVLGSNGEPYRGGARVRIRDANDPAGTYSFTDLATDADGYSEEAPLAIQYYRAVVGSDSVYSPFRLSAIVGADSVATSLSVTYGTDTDIDITLAHTVGGMTVGSPSTVASGVRAANYFKIPRNKSGSVAYTSPVSGLRLFSLVEQYGSSDPAWFYSNDSGGTWSTVAGVLMNNGYANEGHACAYFQDGYGWHYCAPNCAGTGNLYRFVALPCTSATNAGPMRVIDPGYNVRSGVVASGNRTWLALRNSSSSSQYDRVYLYWSDDHFATIAGSQTIYTSSNEDQRIHLTINKEGTVALFVFKTCGNIGFPCPGTGVGIQYWTWNGSAFVAPSNQTIYAPVLNYNDRAMCVTSTTGKWHVFWPIGTTLYHWVSTSGTSWTQTAVSTNTAHSALQYFPTATERNDSVFMFFQTGALATSAAVKVWAEGWDADSLPVSGADVISHNAHQSPEHSPTGLSFVWDSWITTSNQLRINKVTLASAPEIDDADEDGIPDATDNCPAVSNPTQTDSDGDGLGDACDDCPLDADNDIDGDDVCGNVDNCPSVANEDQADDDEDGIGDACDEITVVHTINARVTGKAKAAGKGRVK